MQHFIKLNERTVLVRLACSCKNIKIGYFLDRQSATLYTDLLLRKFIVVAVILLYIFFVYKCLFAGFILVRQHFESHSVLKLYASRFNRFAFKSQKYRIAIAA